MSGSVLVQPLPPANSKQIEEARALRKEELERLCRPLEGIVARSHAASKPTYRLTEAVDEAAEIVLTARSGMTPIDARASEVWREVVDSHEQVLRAMLALGRIDATKADSGIRAQVRDGYPRTGLAELCITRADYEKFGRVVGIEFERGARKEIRDDQYENMVDIIGVLYQLATLNKQPGQVRGIASSAARIISRHTKGSISSKTVSRYLKKGKDRGFIVADEDLSDDKEAE